MFLGEVRRHLTGEEREQESNRNKYVMKAEGRQLGRRKELAKGDGEGWRVQNTMIYTWGNATTKLTSLHS